MSTVPDNELELTAEERAKAPFLRRVRIRGYKSIAFCDVTLEPLTILVGRNASGKSNFVDALAFLRDLMEVGLPEALRRRGGWPAIACRTENASGIEFEIEVQAPPQQGTTDLRAAATYGLRITAEGTSPPSIAREWLDAGSGFEVTKGAVSIHGVEGHIPAVNHLLDVLRPDRPLLSVLGSQPFVSFADGLRSIGVYNFHPDAIRQPQKSPPGQMLERDGRNLARVIETTREIEPWAIERAGRYLSAITRTTEFVGVARSGDYEILRFRVLRNGQGNALEFDAAGMSDGTLRAFAALVATFQMLVPHGFPSLVAIEEPETALHPAAMRALVAALDEATLRTQVLLTTHSAELLDNSMIWPRNVRVAEMVEGRTVITPVDPASLEIVRDKLDTLGGLERQNQLELDEDDVQRQRRLLEAELEAPA